MSKKYIEVPVVDVEKEKVKKRITLSLFVSVFAFVGALICTGLGFLHWALLVAAVVLEITTAFAMLLAFKITMEYRNNGGKHPGK